MGNPLTYDIVVASVFFVAVVIGASAGFRKLFPIPLILLAALPLTARIPWLMQHLPWQMTSPQAGLFIVILLLALVLAIIAVVPRARTAAGRISGAVFAVACAVPIVAHVSLTAALTTDMQEVRKNSVTGPVVFAIGEALLPLPGTPESLFKRPEQPKQ